MNKNDDNNETYMCVYVNVTYIGYIHILYNRLYMYIYVNEESIPSSDVSSIKAVSIPTLINNGIKHRDT